MTVSPNGLRVQPDVPPGDTTRAGCGSGRHSCVTGGEVTRAPASSQVAVIVSTPMAVRRTVAVKPPSMLSSRTVSGPSTPVTVNSIAPPDGGGFTVAARTRSVPTCETVVAWSTVTADRTHSSGSGTLGKVASPRVRVAVTRSVPGAVPR